MLSFPILATTTKAARGENATATVDEPRIKPKEAKEYCRAGLHDTYERLATADVKECDADTLRTMIVDVLPGLKKACEITDIALGKKKSPTKKRSATPGKQSPSKKSKKGGDDQDAETRAGGNATSN